MAGGIGNLVARVFFIAKGTGQPKLSNSKLKKLIKEVKNKCFEAVKEFKFNDALASVWELIGFCDKYINEEKLWETKNIKVINDLFFAINEIGILLEPFLPETAEKIKVAVESKKSEILFPRLNVG